jgi:hypothetical protein
VKNIRPKSVDFRGLKLSPEEGFVLSRIDGPTSVKELANLTSLDEARVADIVSKLAGEGAIELEGAPGGARAPEPSKPEIDTSDAQDEADAAERDAAPPEVDAEEAASDADLDEQDQAFITNERMYREVYAKKYKGEAVDFRVSAALKEDGADLMALCLDPDPQVVHAILQNPRAGLEHARALAFHHRTHMGLEHVAKRADYLADALVQRRLLRNPQLPDSILRRISGRKVLIEVYKIAVDREIPERTRAKVRVELRKKFMLATADERAALLVKTEARVLILLVDCSLDARTTMILVGRNTYSLLFVQNVARWSPAPPKLLAHLLKMQTVRRNPGIRKLLLRHPNMPTEVKKLFV